MGAKTKQVGGTPTAPLAQGFTNYLQNGLSQSGNFSGTVNDLMNGNVGNGQQMFGGNYNLGNMGAAPNLNAQSVQAPQVNLNQFATDSSNVNQPNLNFSNQLNQQYGYNNPQLDLNKYITQIGQTPNIPQYQNTQAPSADINGAYANALQGVLQNSMTQNIDNLRQQYAAGGTGGLSNAGSPAANAEAIYRANALPQLASALGNFNLQQGALVNQNTALNQSGNLGLLGLASSNALGNTGFGIQQNSNLMNSGLTQQGQDISSAFQGQGLNLQNQQNALTNLLNQRQQNLNTGLGNQSLTQQQLGMLGSLAQGNAGLGLQGSLANQSTNLAAQQGNLSSFLQQLAGAQQYNLGLGGLNLQNQGQQLQGQLGTLGNLFNSYQQGNQLGTAQAQTVQQPGMLSQITGALGNIGGGLGSLMLGMGSGGLSSLFSHGIPSTMPMPMNFPGLNLG